MPIARLDTAIHRPIHVSISRSPLADLRDYWALTKPRVLSLVVFTGLCGLLLAPGAMSAVRGAIAVLCIAVGAGGAAVLNQWYERDLDARMRRTRNRPLPAGRLDPQSALRFGTGLSIFSVVLMAVSLNFLAAAILSLSILFYVFIYTIWLKRRTPQNIVIGGAAGAFPALIGWSAATGSVQMLPVLLFMLVFLWTPPHFWSLSLFVNSDYAEAGIPMMSVISGPRSTRQLILFYTIPMAVTALAPWLLGLAGTIYGCCALLLNLGFLVCALRVGFSQEMQPARMKAERRLFGFSIFYLFATFGALVVDHTVSAHL